MKETVEFTPITSGGSPTQSFDKDAVERIERYEPDNGTVLHLKDGKSVTVQEPLDFVQRVLSDDYIPIRLRVG